MQDNERPVVCQHLQRHLEILEAGSPARSGLIR